MKRREFLLMSSLLSSGAAIFLSKLFSFPVTKNRLRVGFIGTGLRGQVMMDLTTHRRDVDIPAICDIDDGMIKKALIVLKKAGYPEPNPSNLQL